MQIETILGDKAGFYTPTVRFANIRGGSGKGHSTHVKAKAFARGRFT